MEALSAEAAHVRGGVEEGPAHVRRRCVCGGWVSEENPVSQPPCAGKEREGGIWAASTSVLRGFGVR